MTTGFDPEAEQEVDFGRYRRLLAARWWLPAAGLRIDGRLQLLPGWH